MEFFAFPTKLVFSESGCHRTITGKGTCQQQLNPNGPAYHNQVQVARSL